MGEEFYCVLKLVSGEEIFSLICIDENDGDPVIILNNPVTIKSIQGPGASFIKIKPWIENSEDDMFIIKLDKVITMTETHDKRMIGVYNKYINDDSDTDNYTPSGKVGVSTEMGYVASVEEARKNLERIFKGIKES